jgi:hypothetical protein
MSDDAIKASGAPIATQCCHQNGGASCLWNTQVYPYTIGPMQMSSVLWYQGEQNANCGGPTQVAGGVYNLMYKVMVKDWRAKFEQPELSFGGCLLAAWKSNDVSSFPLLRLAQANLTTELNHTFIISTLDRGDPNTGAVHSPYKQDVGMRAAWGIAAVTPSLQLANAPYLGPTYSSSRAVSLQPEPADLEAADGSVSASVGVLVTFAAAGLYAAAPIVNSSVVCPPKIPSSNCESFAVLSAPDCVWRAAVAHALAPTDAGASNTIVIKPLNWTTGAGLTIAATRGKTTV